MAAVIPHSVFDAVHVFSDAQFVFGVFVFVGLVWFLVTWKYDFFTWRRSVEFKPAPWLHKPNLLLQFVLCPSLTTYLNPLVLLRCQGY